jgi:hypothetical protein
VNPAGRWRGDPTLPLAVLRSRWVADSSIVYIGSAERPSPSSTNSLRTRVKAYLRFGSGGNARHSGGYPTWQLRDSADLLIAWRIVRPPLTPRGLEGQLINDHERRFGAIPFANSARPQTELEA